MIFIVLCFIFACLIPDINTGKITSCPTKITSALKVKQVVYLFENKNVWKHDGKRIYAGPLKLNDIFPNVPGVNTSCTSSKDVIYLFYMKKVYAYVCEHKTGKFNLLDKHPIELQPMIIPFPIKCFPLNNGSLMIGSGTASYTYYPEENVPHMSGDFYEQFPGLPAEFISGFPIDNNYNNYLFLDKLNASKYSFNDFKLEATDLKNYLNCKVSS
uniref:Uncharacterized protein n=2 Tax=Meloidogyne incognita TaxID=6306 RepID=A0A914N7J8_MELIC